MTRKEPTLTDRIRSILREADGPMTLSDVFNAIPGVADRDTVSALLSQRKKAGEFDVQIVDRKPAYTINSSFVAGVRKEDVSTSAASVASPVATVAPTRDSAPPSAPDGTAGDATAQPSTAASPARPKRARSRAVKRMAEIVTELNRAAPAGGELTNEDAERFARNLLSTPLPGDDLTKPFGLLDRLSAIGEDLRDAFGDACDAGCSPKALHGLFEALYATQTTQITLLRSNP